MTPQQQLANRLQSAGLPHREIKVYGSQITVDVDSISSAQEWAGLLSQFASVRGTIETRVRNKENRGTSLRPTTSRAWRVYARI